MSIRERGAGPTWGQGARRSPTTGRLLTLDRDGCFPSFPNSRASFLPEPSKASLWSLLCLMAVPRVTHCARGGGISWRQSPGPSLRLGTWGLLWSGGDGRAAFHKQAPLCGFSLPADQLLRLLVLLLSVTVRGPAGSSSRYHLSTTHSVGPGRPSYACRPPRGSPGVSVCLLCVSSSAAALVPTPGGFRCSRLDRCADPVPAQLGNASVL